MKILNEISAGYRYNCREVADSSLYRTPSMFEKPQYLTPEGYRRMAKNPVSGKHRAANTALMLIRKKKTEFLAQRAGTNPGPGKKPVLSEEAAKAIAMAISGMLRK
jgi:hypothetical protein